MSNQPSVENVLAALPSVRRAVEAEIAVRVANGEDIVSEDTPAIRATLVKRRAKLDVENSISVAAGMAGAETGNGPVRHKSAA